MLFDKEMDIQCNDFVAEFVLDLRCYVIRIFSSSFPDLGRFRELACRIFLDSDSYAELDRVVLQAIWLIEKIRALLIVFRVRIPQKEKRMVFGGLTHI